MDEIEIQNKRKAWVNHYLRDIYGLEDNDVLIAGEIEELLDYALYRWDQNKNNEVQPNPTS